jgi:NADP-dependent 3-hydroxy acid dehydrogenase YdfG
MAKKLHEEGDTVIIVGPKLEAVEKAEEELQVDGIKGDVASETDWERLVRYVKEQYGRVDILVNAASLTLTGHQLEEETLRSLRDNASLGVLSTLWGVKAFLPLMKENKSGAIVNLARKAEAGEAEQAAFVGGLKAFSRNLSASLKDSGIKVLYVFAEEADDEAIACASLSALDLPKEAWITEEVVTGKAEKAKKK